MNQWRILHTESSRGWGGQEIRVFKELEWMQEHGHEVALAAHPKSMIARKAKAAGIRFFPLDTRKSVMPFAILRLAFWIFWHRFHVVNTHSSNDGWLGGLAARLAGTPVIIRSRHIEVDYPRKFWSRIAFRKVPHYILTTSERIRQRLIKEIEVEDYRIECIPTGVNLERFSPTVLGQLKSECKLTKDTVLIGMISVLRSWKGHRTLLDAMEELFSGKLGEIPSTHLFIAGEGPGKEEIKQWVDESPVREHITLLGHRSDVPNLLASLDIIVLPSKAHEGIPQIILQAQAMGKAVVASAIGGIPEVVQHEKTGLLVPPQTPHLLAEALALLIRDPEMRKNLGLAAQIQVINHHSDAIMGNRLLELYEKLAGIQ